MRKISDHKRLLAALKWEGSWDELSFYARNAAKNLSGQYYHQHVIAKPKSPGEFRPVDAPVPRLKQLQRDLYRLLDKRVQFSECVHGGIRGRSYLTNVEVHRGNRHFFLVDLKNFYQAITSKMVYAALSELVTPDLATVLTPLVTVEGHVPTGAPSSVFIGNLVLQGLDADLQTLAIENGIRYSRYVDDLTFSHRRDFSRGVPSQIIDTILKYQFVPKYKKTKYNIGATMVTGVIVDQCSLRASDDFVQRLNLEASLNPVSDRFQGMLAHANAILEANSKHNKGMKRRTGTSQM